MSDVTVSKATPGPWVAGPPATGLDPCVERYIHAGGELVARAVAGYLPNRRLAGDLEANARLIAASPDLLAALRRVLTVGNRSDFSIKQNRDDFDAAIRDGWRAIAKAEGESEAHA